MAFYVSHMTRTDALAFIKASASIAATAKAKRTRKGQAPGLRVGPDLSTRWRRPKSIWRPNFRSSLIAASVSIASPEWVNSSVDVDPILCL